MAKTCMRLIVSYIAGATLCKCLNRMFATFLAGALGVGVHLLAKQSGEKFEHLIMGVALFIFGLSTIPFKLSFLFFLFFFL